LLTSVAISVSVSVSLCRKRVFLSYSQDGQWEVTALAAALGASGLLCAPASGPPHRDDDGSASQANGEGEALAGCDLVVVFYSQEHMASARCMSHRQRAIDLQKPVLVVDLLPLASPPQQDDDSPAAASVQDQQQQQQQGQQQQQQQLQPRQPFEVVADLQQQQRERFLEFASCVGWVPWSAGSDTVVDTVLSFFKE
jgi:hypothetical protein